jgi:hypothetical protein
MSLQYGEGVRGKRDGVLIPTKCRMVPGIHGENAIPAFWEDPRGLKQTTLAVPDKSARKVEKCLNYSWLQGKLS